MAFRQPTHTQVSNELLGNIGKGNIFEPGLMADLTGGELKLLLAIFRITVGFHRGKRRASIRDLAKMTGMSNAGIQRCAKRLRKKDFVAKGAGTGVTEWLINPRFVSSQEEVTRRNYHEYLKSPEWQARRKTALKRADHKCQLCYTGGQLNVHHRTYERVGNEKNSDLTVLCVDCHRKFHGIEEPS